ncbi:unnamed protein product [Caenorhabditis auriculariae]|uniref:EF-hand domain-containing protein n=1 Tax=Caenorhabditis auriculariae TaxID=2777116 RepID=A0A8S1HAW1_9PELO|nr:unnamed protein product [Caenorhabditis auriculariae]
MSVRNAFLYAFQLAIIALLCRCRESELEDGCENWSNKRSTEHLVDLLRPLKLRCLRLDFSLPMALIDFARCSLLPDIRQRFSIDRRYRRGYNLKWVTKALFPWKCAAISMLTSFGDWLAVSKKLDIDGSGSLSVEEFMSLPELQQNPLVQRVIDIFDEDGNGEVDFREFIQGISQFSVKGDKNIKLRFAFRIYDMDRDGFISNGELFQVLKMMVGNNLKDSQLQQIVDKTILFHDKDGDGKISFQEFCDVVEHTEVHKKMVLENI